MVDLAVDKLAFFDRRRRIRECSACADRLDRFRSGMARTEAFAWQLSELRALPTVEPNRRLAW
jgi:hypothetical protein